MDVDAVVVAYLEHLRYLNRRPSSIGHRGAAIRRLARFAAPRSLLELGRDDLRAFVMQESLGAEARNNDTDRREPRPPRDVTARRSPGIRAASRARHDTEADRRSRRDRADGGFPTRAAAEVPRDNQECRALAEDRPERSALNPRRPRPQNRRPHADGNRAISHARGFYRWAIERGLVDVDPTAGLERPRRPRRLPRPMPSDAVALALRAAPDPIRQWLYLATYAGLRACEIAQLSGADFMLEQSPPVLVVQESKGGDTQSVPVGPGLMVVARELSTARGWCFPKGVGDPSARSWSGHVTAGQVQKRANRFLHEVGIPQTLHQLRHWYGTNLLQASGGNLRVAQEGLRHRSANSTAIYTFVSPGDVAQALDGMPRLTA